MYARDGKVFVVTDNKQVGIDKSTPVVYPLKVESGLNTVMSRSFQVILHIRAIGPHPFEEIHSGIKSKHSVFWECIDRVLAEPCFVLLIKVLYSVA